MAVTGIKVIRAGHFWSGHFYGAFTHRSVSVLLG